MRKVGIITIHRINNYGSMLQAHALQQAVDNLGHRAEIIDYLYPNAVHPTYPDLKHRLLTKASGVVKAILAPGEFGRFDRRFKQFMHQHMRVPQFYPNAAALAANPPAYDVYVAGSDQIWNPDCVGIDPAFYLDFAPPGAKRISYASSFGWGQIAPCHHASMGRLLNKFQHLGVREQTGVEIVKTLTGKRAELVLDPTLLLDASYWQGIATPPAIKEPYILCYGFDADRRTLAVARHLRSKMGLKIVVLYGRPYDRMNNRDIEYVFDAGPQEWLGLVKNAAVVVTRSFHGTIFSVNFSRPFISLFAGKGSDAANRQVSILKLLGLERQGFPADTAVEDIAVPEVDFTVPHKLLAGYREASLKYLRDAIGC